MDAALNLEGYTTEVTVPEDPEFAGKTVKDLEALSETRSKSSPSCGEGSGTSSPPAA